MPLIPKTGTTLGLGITIRGESSAQAVRIAADGYHQATVLRLCSPRYATSLAMAQRGLMKDTRAPSVFLRLAQT